MHFWRLRKLLCSFSLSISFQVCTLSWKLISPKEVQVEKLAESSFYSDFEGMRTGKNTYSDFLKFFLLFFGFLFCVSTVRGGGIIEIHLLYTKLFTCKVPFHFRRSYTKSMKTGCYIQGGFLWPMNLKVFGIGSSMLFLILHVRETATNKEQLKAGGGWRESSICSTFLTSNEISST